MIELSATSRSFWRSKALQAALILISVQALGCGAGIPDSETPEDSEERSTFDDRDLAPMFERAKTSLDESGLARLWQAYQRQGQVTHLGLLMVENQTEVPLDSKLLSEVNALGSSLAELGVNVVSRVDQPQLSQSLRDPESGALDKSKLAQLGVELKVSYLLTGKLYTVTPPGAESDSAKRHYLFLQAIDVKRGSIPWQFEVEAVR